MRISTALILLVTTAAAQSRDLQPLRMKGVTALPTLLRLAHGDDADLRLRARRMATLVVLDYYRAQTPKAMCLVPGRVVLAPEAASMRGGVYLATHEVTAREFIAYATAQGMKVGRWSSAPPERPITNVTYAEAAGYAAWRGARLPTRDELLHAATCRGRARYPWGNRFEAFRVNSRESGLGVALRPGARSAGRSTDGLYDLLGNVAEWTTTPAKRGGRLCVCGGSYMRRAEAAISGGRFVSYRLTPESWRKDVGIRLARSLPDLPEPPRKRRGGGSSGR